MTDPLDPQGKRSEAEEALREGMASYRDRMIGWIVNGGVSRVSATHRVDALIALARAVSS